MRLNLVIMIAFLLGACTPLTHTRGNMVEDFRLATIKAGEDNRSDVLRKIGSPTTRAPFDDNVWYYIGQTTEKRGIMDESVKKERIVVVSFTEDGIVDAISDEEGNRIAIPYIREKTETSGNEVTVLQQLLGNVGRFNQTMNE